MNDCVLSYHLNPKTCGVAKANHRLARELGIPIHRLTEPARYPIVSIKPSELVSEPYINAPRYDLWLHGPVPRPWRLLERASRVFYATETGCPSTLQGNPSRAILNVLLFGMAHKIDVHTVYLERLRDLLERAGCGYTVSVSTAVHEGSPWDATFDKTERNLRKVLGDRVRVLGYLADDALAYELAHCAMVALFFDPAVRANNTTLWAALDAGAPVLTNLDRESPPELQHGETVFDLARMTDWPLGDQRDRVAAKGQALAETRTWAKLAEVFRAA